MGIEESDLIIVLGGPSMLVGLGGGAASSKHSSKGNEELDFASVQRENAEMQRRCQEVIDKCSNSLKNIIISRAKKSNLFWSTIWSTAPLSN